MSTGFHIGWWVQVVVVAEADAGSIPLADREDLHIKPDPDAMTDGHANGLDIKVPHTVLQLLHCCSSCTAVAVSLLQFKTSLVLLITKLTT